MILRLLLIFLFAVSHLEAKKSIAFVGDANGTNFVDATTRYLPIYGRMVNSTDTVDLLEGLLREAGTFSNAYVRVRTNTASNASTVTLQDSRVDTSLVVSVTADGTGAFEDTANTATLAATDEMNWEVVVPTEAGTNNLNLSVIAVQFEPTTTTNTHSFLHSSTTTNTFATASSTRYFVPQGQLAVSVETAATDPNRRILTTVTSSNFFANVYTNARGTDTTFATVKNSSAGGQSVVFATTVTGWIEDTTNSDSLVSGDDFAYSITTGTGVGNIGSHVAGSKVISTDDKFYITNGITGGAALVFATTVYATLGGAIETTTTEAQANYVPRFDLYLSDLQVYVSAEASAGTDPTVTVMDNGAGSALTLSITGTGLFSGPSDVVTITSTTDEVSYQLVGGGTTGNTTIDWIGVIGTETAPAPPAAGAKRLTLLGVG